MSAVTPLPNGQSRSDSCVMRVRRSQSLLVTVCMCVELCIFFRLFRCPQTENNSFQTYKVEPHQP